jgi:hypothetical protein
MWAPTLLDPLERTNLNSIIFPEDGNRSSFGNVVFFRNNGRQTKSKTYFFSNMSYIIVKCNELECH